MLALADNSKYVTIIIVIIIHTLKHRPIKTHNRNKESKDSTLFDTTIPCEAKKMLLAATFEVQNNNIQTSAV